MKKLICSFLLLAAVLAHGQGRVNFANGSSTTPITNGTTGLLITGAGSFYFGLYVGPVGSSELQLTLILLATNTALAGRLSGGNPAPLPAPYADGSNYPFAFQIRGWSAAGGLSYEEARIARLNNPMNILVGRTIMGEVTPTFAPDAAAPLFGTAGGGRVHGFTIGEWETPLVPEPSTIALGVLGLAAMALLRRKK